MRLRHARQDLELHVSGSSVGPNLLVLHAQFSSAAEAMPLAAAWPGRVYALDFPGHGASDWIGGGAYCPEHLVASADIALQHIDGPTAVAGVGLGAYIALLLAGGRADSITGALLVPGAGLDGAGPEPNPGRVATLYDLLPARPVAPGTDPLVVGLDLFCRPPEYAARFAQAARSLLLAEDGGSRPPWWEEVRKSPRATVMHDDPAILLNALTDLT